MKESLFTRLLNYYHLDEETYLDITKPVTIDNFASGHVFKDMNKAVKLVKEAVANKDKIFIYGDYDADGIMSTSIVTKSLLRLGLIPSYYIPNRYNDGYGITLEKAKEIVSSGVKLVITVDNGISAFEPIDYLKSEGVKVLIIDHHVAQDKVPNADVIIHPQYSGFGETPTSAGFTSFMFSWALLGYFDKYLSSLAAISVISDMMPLKDYNRNFLRLVFSNYRNGEFYAIDLLKEDHPFDENAIGLKIAPKINALGRLLDDTSINYIVRYFVTSDHEKIDRLYAWISDMNEKRKLESRSAEEAYTSYSSNKEAIVIFAEIKEGLLGILANQLCSKEHKPTIVFTEEKDCEVLKGSCRAPEGFNVIDAFNYCGDLLLTAGGHALAGGCSIYKKDLEKFEAKFVEYAKNNPIVKEDKQGIDLGLTEITYDNYKLIQSFSPFGEGWKAPKLKVSHVKADTLTYSKNNDHILTYISVGVRLTGFNFPKSMMKEYKFVDMFGKLRTSVYRDQETLEFLIKDVVESK